MNMLIIFGIAAGCILAEWLWTAMELPRVNAWWARVLLVNSIQLGITVLAGQTWNRWLGSHVDLSTERTLQRLLLSSDHLFLLNVCLLLVASVSA